MARSFNRTFTLFGWTVRIIWWPTSTWTWGIIPDDGFYVELGRYSIDVFRR